MSKKKEEKILIDWNFIFITTINIIICCLLLIGVLYFGFVEKYQAMWGIAASFAFIIFILNIEKFEEFKIGKSGVEAKMRKVIEEAYATIEENKRMGRILLFFSLNSLISNVENYNMQLEKCMTIFQESIEYSKELGLFDSKEIQNLNDEFLKSYAFRLHLDIYSSISRIINNLNIPIEEKNKLIEKNNDFRNFPKQNGLFDSKSIDIFLDNNNLQRDELLLSKINRYILFVEKNELI